MSDLINRDRRRFLQVDLVVAAAPLVVDGPADGVVPVLFRAGYR